MYMRLANAGQRNLTMALIAGIVLFWSTSTVTAQDNKDAPSSNVKPSAESDKKEKSDEPFKVATENGAVEFLVIGKWKKVPNKSSMLDVELRIPGKTEKDEAGRLTIMGAGGTVEANIIRWESQFQNADGKSPSAKKEIKEIGGHKVHLVELEGTYIDTPRGPFAGGETIKRQNYRMLAAIVPTPQSGNYFVKFYGPKELVNDNADHFKSMIESLKIKEE